MIWGGCRRTRCPRARPILLLGDPVARHHAAGHMIGDMAVEQPGPDIVRMHIDDLGGRGKQLDRVGPRAPAQHPIAVPMSGVDIVLVAEADQIPADALSATHSEAVEIAVEQPVMVCSHNNRGVQYARACSTRLGDDADEPRQCARSSRGAGLSRGAEGMDEGSRANPLLAQRRGTN